MPSFLTLPFSLVTFAPCLVCFVMLSPAFPFQDGKHPGFDGEWPLAYCLALPFSVCSFVTAVPWLTPSVPQPFLLQLQRSVPRRPRFPVCVEVNGHFSSPLRFDSPAPVCPILYWVSTSLHGIRCPLHATTFYYSHVTRATPAADPQRHALPSDNPAIQSHPSFLTAYDAPCWPHCPLLALLVSVPVSMVSSNKVLRRVTGMPYSTVANQFTRGEDRSVTRSPN